MRKHFSLLLAALCSCLLGVAQTTYEIGTPAEFLAFAEAVNNGESDANAVLTADIDLDGLDVQCIGMTTQFYNKAAALSEVGYAGHFDGQGHVIWNAIINWSGTPCAQGLFGTNTGTIENVLLNIVQFFGLESAGDGRYGILCGVNMGTIRNCWVTNSNIRYSGICGAIAGGNYGGLIESCYEWGNRVDNHARAGHLVGDGRDDNAVRIGTIKNCCSDEYVSGDGCPGGRPGTDINCKNFITWDTLESGEVCYYLNGCNWENPVWFQNLGEERIPTLDNTHKVVYAGGDLRCDGHAKEGGELTFSNTKTQEIPNHTFVDGICTECGAMGTSTCEIDEEGFYLVETAEQLLWVIAQVNSGTSNIKVKLTADIDLAESDKFQCIGRTNEFYNKAAAISEVGFNGHFDGQGHVIRNAVYQWSGKAAAEGCFGTNTGTIENLGLYNFQFQGLESAGDGRYGILCGVNMGTIKNCYVVNSFISYAAGICGAIAGGNYGGVIESCFEFNNQVDNHARAGHLVGDGRDDNVVRVGTLRNCFSDEFVSGDGCPGGRPGTDIDCKGFVTAEQYASGEIAALLNQGTKTPAWFQNIGGDPYPVLDNTHGFVILNGEEIVSFGSDDYQEAWTYIVNSEMPFVSDAVGEAALIGEFEDFLNGVDQVESFAQFLELYASVQTLKAKVQNSVDAYAVYTAKIAEVMEYLKEHNNFMGETRRALESYLGESVDPCDEFPNGSYPYIMEVCELDAPSILIEAEFAQALLDAAIANGYQPGANVTTLVVNPYLADGKNGWTVEGALSVTANETQNVGTSTAKTFDMSQIISDLTPGYYEIQVNAAYVANQDKQGFGQNSFVYLNDNYVYTPAAREGMVEYSEESPYNAESDPVYGEDAPIGLIPNSAKGFGMAFADGNYLTSMVAEVGEDGELKLGICTPGCRTGNTTYVGNWELNFLGDLDSEFTGAALDRALASQTARLQNLVENYICDDFDYKTSPNYYGGQTEEAQNLIAEAAGASTNEAKYAVLQKMSQLAQDIYNTKQAYADMMDKAEALNDVIAVLSADGLFSDEDLKKADAVCATISDAYIEGTLTREQALAVNPFEGVPGVPEEKDNVLQLTTPLNFVIFATLVNTGAYSQKDAVLTEDIDLGGVSSFTSVGRTYEFYNKAAAISEIGYAGHFDGQGHVVKNINCAWSGVSCAEGLFGTNMGTIENLGVDNFQFINFNASDGRYGILCGVNMGTIKNCYVVNSAINYSAGICGAIAGGNYGGTVENCYEFGNTVLNHSRSGHLVGDGRDDNQVRVGVIRNSYSDSFVSGAGRSGGRPGTDIDCQSHVEPARFASGEIAYLLNGSTSEGDLTWYQTIGRDASPVLDNTHLVVRLTENGTYANFDETNTNLLALVGKANGLAASTRMEDGAALITSADQLSDNCLWQAGYEIGKMYDNDLLSYFHSRIDTPLENGTEYFQVALNTPVQAFNFEWYGRRDGAGTTAAWHDTPDRYLIKASNTPEIEESWVEIGTYEYPVENIDGAYYKTTEPIVLNGSYTNIRFYVLHATSNNPYWNITEFQMFSAGNDNASLYATNEEIRAAVDAIEALCQTDEEKAITGAGTEDDLKALQAAYDALNELINNAGNDVEGILATEKNSITVFNLMGQKVEKAQKGIFIINGKKVLVK